MLGACALVAWRVERRFLPTLTGAPRALALALVFSAALIGVHLLPGLAGAFTSLGVLVTALVAGAVALALVPRTRGPAPAAGGEGVGRVAAAVAFLVAGCAVALVRDLAGAPITSIDAQNFQVPVIARWLQDDSLWGLHQFVPDYSNATYPMHGNLLVAAFVLPFESAFLARLVAVPYWGLAALAAYAGARELGAPRSSAVLAGASLAALPVSIRAGLEGVQTDLPMLAFMGAGVVFLLRHARTRATSELVLAGVGLGLAFGTKWYAVTAVAAIVVVWALARRRRIRLPELAWLAGTIALVGGVWLLRNWIETGNPLFPQPLGPFDAPPDPLRDSGGFTLADYALDFGVWERYLVPAFASSFGWTGAALAAGTVLAAARRPRLAVLAVLAATIALAGLYAVTPYSAFGPEGRPVLAGASTRYALPALLGAALLTAWALGRLRGRSRLAGELLLAVAVVDGLRRGFSDLSTAKAIGGALVAAGLTWAALSLRVRPRPAAAAAVVVAIGLLVAVDATRRRANDAGYGRFDPTLAWIEAEAPAGKRVGLAGTWSTEAVSPVLPAFGPRLANDVRYVGEFREGMLRSLADRPREFRAALRGLDLLIVGRGAPPRPAVIEEAHARAAGWVPVVASERLSLWRAP